MTDIRSITTVEEHVICQTSYDCPPIPVRGVDWSAAHPDYDEGGPIGRGETEAKAVEDFYMSHLHEFQPVGPQARDALEAHMLTAHRDKLDASADYCRGFTDALSALLRALE